MILAVPITTPGHEKDLALTTTYAADDTGSVLEPDVVFNTRYVFATMPSPGGARRPAAGAGRHSWDSRSR